MERTHGQIGLRNQMDILDEQIGWRDQIEKISMDSSER